MDAEKYRRRLLDIEKQLSARTARGVRAGRAQGPDTPGDAGDASVASEEKSEVFTEAELDTTVLQHVRDALARIDDESYGRCIVDGEPIEEKRLDAVPWTPYCLKHQQLLEAASQPQTPTL